MDHPGRAMRIAWGRTTDRMAVRLLIPSDRAATICPSPTDWIAPRKIWDWYAAPRRPSTEDAEPEEKEQDEDGEAPEEPDVDPDDGAHRAGAVDLAERHREPESEPEGKGAQNKTERGADARKKIWEPVDED